MARSQLTRSRTRDAWIFLIPMLTILGLVAAWPLLRTIWYGFTNANLSDLSQAEFVGFENYLTKGNDGRWYGLLADDLWWDAVWNTLWFALISVSIETGLGLIVALVLNASFKLRGVVRTAVLIPWAIPTIVSAKMWGWILNGQFGMFNDILRKTHIINEPVSWTADPNLMMKSVIMVDVWKTTPFMALLILAALQMLPTSCYEAAKVDGIHPLKVFWRVTLPLIKPALMVAVIFRFLDALRIFDLVYVLTSSSRDTMTMSIYARQQLVDFQEVGPGSAASTLLFIIVALCTILYITLGRVRFDGGR
jgi:trehalose/maltose transport system permease protein